MKKNIVNPNIPKIKRRLDFELITKRTLNNRKIIKPRMLSYKLDFSILLIQTLIFSFLFEIILSQITANGLGYRQLRELGRGVVSLIVFFPGF